MRVQKYFSEFVGTFCLVFAGCGAVVVDQLRGGRVTNVGIGLVFGLAVLAMIYSIGHISGAHLNPAVTIGFWSSRRIYWREAIWYIAAQIFGAIVAALFLRLTFGASTSLGTTLPSASWSQAFLMEFALTFILMFVIMGVATDDRAESLMAGVAIGGTICFEAIFGGPISGASMNPARSFGPALVSGNFSFHWIYWVAPILGSIAGACAYRAVRCQSDETPSTTGCC